MTDRINEDAKRIIKETQTMENDRMTQSSWGFRPLKNKRGHLPSKNDVGSARKNWRSRPVNGKTGTQPTKNARNTHSRKIHTVRRKNISALESFIIQRAKGKPNEPRWLCKVLNLDQRSSCADLASHIAAIPAVEILEVMKATHIISTEGFWKALFRDTSRALHDVFKQVEIGENAKRFYRDYNPVSYWMKGEEKIFYYRFWEMLYVECGQMLQQEDVCGVLEYLIEDPSGKTSKKMLDTMPKFLEFPFVTFFLGVRFGRFRSSMAYRNSAVYAYLPFKEHKMDIELLSGAPVVVKALMKRKSLTTNQRLSAFTSAIRGGFTETVLLLGEENLLNAPVQTRLEGIEDIRAHQRKDFRKAFANANQEMIELFLDKGWVSVNSLDSDNKKIYINNVLRGGMERVYMRDPIFKTDVTENHLFSALCGENETIIRSVFSRIETNYSEMVVSKLIESSYYDILRSVVMMAQTTVSSLSMSYLVRRYRWGFTEGVRIVCGCGFLDSKICMALYRWAMEEEVGDIAEALREFQLGHQESKNYTPLVIASLEGDTERLVKMCQKIGPPEFSFTIGHLIVDGEYKIAKLLLERLDLGDQTSSHWEALLDVITEEGASSVLRSYIGAYDGYDAAKLLGRVYHKKDIASLKVLTERGGPRLEAAAEELLREASNVSELSGVFQLLAMPSIAKKEAAKREAALRSLFLREEGTGPVYTSDIPGVIAAIGDKAARGLVEVLGTPELDFAPRQVEILTLASEWDTAVMAVLLADPRMMNVSQKVFLVPYYSRIKDWKMLCSIVATWPIDQQTVYVTAILRSRDAVTLRSIIPALRPTISRFGTKRFQPHLEGVSDTNIECLSLLFDASELCIDDLLMVRFASTLVVDKPEMAMYIIQKVSSRTMRWAKRHRKPVLEAIRESLSKLERWGVNEGAVLSVIKTSGLSEYLEQALEKGVDPSSQNDDALFIASRYNMKGLVKRLLNDRRVLPHTEESASFQVACRFGDEELVELFLADGRVSLSANENQALINAAFAGKEEIVRLLLAHKEACTKDSCLGEGCAKVCPRARKNLAGSLASHNGHSRILEMLQY